MTTSSDSEDDLVLRQAEDDLSYTNSIRKDIVNRLAKPGNKNLDNGEIRLLIDSLGSLEKVALARMKMKSDKENSRNMTEFAVELAKYVAENTGFSPDVKNRVGDIPEPDSALIDHHVVEEFELGSNDNTLTYKEFKDEHGA